MNAIYCKNCGKPNKYALKKPEKCESCNNALFVIQSSVSKPYKKIEIVEDDEVEAEESFETPQLTRIEISPIPNWKNIRQPASNIVGSMEGQNVPVRSKTKKVNMKKFMEEFRREASPSRESIPVGD